ncbi:MAG: hypothetical protein Q7I99_01755 [Acholeplasmataceae bacterium]|nr:hypothetical protein [Acholeplasmataceae bacterium]
MKKIVSVLVLMLTLIISACSEVGSPSTPVNLEDYPCKDTPLAEGCFIPSSDLDHISANPEEYLINEVFDTERVGSNPRNWLLYRNQEYAVDGVRTVIAEETGGNRYVRMYSDGLRAPMYPQSAPTPTFIFTTKFNLDIDRKGVAFANIMIPNDVSSNEVTLGVATGAVNTIGVTIGQDLKVSVKLGGPFFYYSGSGDGGDTIATSLTITKGNWYTFKFEWDASTNLVAAYLVDDQNQTLLHSGSFHISNRVNALANGDILVPNVFKVTMPRYSAGWAYLDRVIVERKGA